MNGLVRIKYIWVRLDIINFTYRCTEESYGEKGKAKSFHCNETSDVLFDKNGFFVRSFLYTKTKIISREARFPMDLK